ncbi:MAG: putative DNA binding domain-containing protein [Candidatus Cloacimonetes bacterium]|nr:putative DNA binding domain-containing protein [Candidatus Cloacimonadota bacterium]
MTTDQLHALIRDLCSLSHENETVEFKSNYTEPKEIGEYISALSNSATLVGKSKAYIVWGIENVTHTIIGSKFRPRNEKVKNEELENWLARQLDPNIHFTIHETEIESKHIVLFKIPAATYAPVEFDEEAYIRVGSCKQKLRKHREKERELWRLFDKTPFEKRIAEHDVSSDDVIHLLDYPGYFKLLSAPLPDNKSLILERLTSDKLISKSSGDKYHILNLGAILIAQDLNEFESLTRKGLRVIQYKGDDKVETIREQTGRKGYAIGFKNVLTYIDNRIPRNEQIRGAFREEISQFPPLAIRELVANALIHQDFNVSGTGPMVEIFENRLEIANPGKPLINSLRFIDDRPQSRNEKLASMLRKMNICEERGSGYKKVFKYVELFQLPAPAFRITESSTLVILYGPRSLSDMDKMERIKACYYHACLLFVTGKRMTNSSLRERLGIEGAKYTTASNIIRDTIEEELIKHHSGIRKSACYVPFWE